MKPYQRHHLYSATDYQSNPAYTVLLEAFRTVSDADNLYDMGHMLIQHLENMRDILIEWDKQQGNPNYHRWYMELFAKTVLAILTNRSFVNRWSEVKIYLEEKFTVTFLPRIQRTIVDHIRHTKDLQLKRELIEMVLSAEDRPLYDFLRTQDSVTRLTRVKHMFFSMFDVIPQEVEDRVNLFLDLQTALDKLNGVFGDEPASPAPPGL